MHSILFFHITISMRRNCKQILHQPLSWWIFFYTTLLDILFLICCWIPVNSMFWIHARTKKFCQRGVQLWQRWSGEGGYKYHYKQAISWPSSTRQRNAIKIAFRWRADDGPTLNADLVALWFFRGSGPVLVRNPICLRFSLWIRASKQDRVTPCFINMVRVSHPTNLLVALNACTRWNKCIFTPNLVAAQLPLLLV